MLKATLLILTFSISHIVLADCDSSMFAGGDGTSSDPWQISTPEQLDHIRHCPDDHYFQQINDIDLNVAPWNEGDGWQPINASISDFFIHYDGGGYTISNLFIDNDDAFYVGLFGYVSASTISNLGLRRVSVHGSAEVGALVAWANRQQFDDQIVISNIENVWVTGTVSGNNFVGGVIGNLRGSARFMQCECDVDGAGTVGGIIGGLDSSPDENPLELSDSRFYGQVNAESLVGGLVGSTNEDAWILRSHVVGDISGNDQVGGLSGRARSQVVDSYMLGSVAGVEQVGGAVGEQTSSGSLQNVYVATQIDGEDEVAGLIGRNSNEVPPESSFWDEQASGLSGEFDATAKTTSELTKIETFTDTDTDGLDSPWDFDDVWAIDPEINDGYPYLLGNPPIELPDMIFHSRFEE
ncbi:hypothetical protein IC757_14510 [Wenzhouxiangella sp. AB-CW3]|uniref:hypothetical protein n=1 Tax=Wenzhouxiangella sp. AB-CW3 TaxID=2771012 RepID=UPI00168B125B|nr:hypothetical protein [Wenzhouxiangella sp. AB-CW3]QOC22212.1 hypothetical protein IC757_14510 [Wenzhouxiangella sp. AB-CW3]